MKRYRFYISKVSKTVFEDLGPVFVESKYIKFPFFEGTMDDLKAFVAKELLVSHGKAAYLEVETCDFIDNHKDLLELQIESLQYELDGECEDVPTDKMAWLIEPTEEPETKK